MDNSGGRGGRLRVVWIGGGDDGEPSRRETNQPREPRPRIVVGQDARNFAARDGPRPAPSLIITGLGCWPRTWHVHIQRGPSGLPILSWLLRPTSVFFSLDKLRPHTISTHTLQHVRSLIRLLVHKHDLVQITTHGSDEYSACYCLKKNSTVITVDVLQVSWLNGKY